MKWKKFDFLGFEWTKIFVKDGSLQPPVSMDRA